MRALVPCTSTYVVRKSSPAMPRGLPPPSIARGQESGGRTDFRDVPRRTYVLVLCTEWRALSQAVRRRTIYYLVGMYFEVLWTMYIVHTYMYSRWTGRLRRAARRGPHIPRPPGPTSRASAVAQVLRMIYPDGMYTTLQRSMSDTRVLWSVPFFGKCRGSRRLPGSSKSALRRSGPLLGGNEKERLGRTATARSLAGDPLHRSAPPASSVLRSIPPACRLRIHSPGHGVLPAKPREKKRRRHAVPSAIGPLKPSAIGNRSIPKTRVLLV